jgi:hypothetical protein
MATRGQRTRPLTESGDGGTYVSAADSPRKVTQPSPRTLISSPRTRATRNCGKGFSMKSALKAGLIYVAIVFAAGFLLGVLRSSDWLRSWARDWL